MSKSLGWFSIAFIGMVRLASADCLTVSNGLQFSGPTANDAVVGCQSDYRTIAVQCQQNVRCDVTPPAPYPQPYPPQPYNPAPPAPYPPYPSYPQPYPQYPTYPQYPSYPSYPSYPTHCDWDGDECRPWPGDDDDHEGWPGGWHGGDDDHGGGWHGGDGDGHRGWPGGGDGDRRPGPGPGSRPGPAPGPMRCGWRPC